MATPGVLHNVRVVDFAWYIAGPMIGKYLSQYGAEVIRVETDGLSRSAPPVALQRQSATSQSVGGF